MLTALLVFALVGYVLGALPFGYLVARAKGVDIFSVGSGNPGATNVRRVLGRGPGNLVFFLDAAKGAAAAGLPLLASRLGWISCGAGDVTIAGIVGLAGGLLGHSFSCFTGFRGGKGVATTVGGFAVLLPWGLLAASVVWVAVFFIGRYVSLASILGAVALPLAAWLLGAGRPLVGLAVAVAAFVIIMHRSNIRRLRAGTESRFSRSGGSAPRS
ncbi:MAG: glycerol-3-phosphate 1-O-acyltransferase PlsY [Opitutaceae bacterium]